MEGDYLASALYWLSLSNLRTNKKVPKYLKYILGQFLGLVLYHPNQEKVIEHLKPVYDTLTLIMSWFNYFN